MNHVLDIKVLGELSISLNGEELTCASRKTLWMSAYVLLNKKPQLRTKIAALFWAGTSSVNALGSLRVALTKLPRPVLDCLDITRDSIGVAPGAQYRLDVEEFQSLCTGGGGPGTLQQAVPLYRGDLLSNVDEDVAPEFSDWLFSERNRLRQLAHGAHVTLAQHLYARNQHAEAQGTVEAWLAHDPANESMHRLMITWLAEAAGSDRALAQYEVYRRALAVHHGAAPSPEMRTLGDRLRDGGQDRIRSRELPPDIAPATSFFGRSDELAVLRELLSGQDCRLLTLHGLGGVGKTRLALAAAANAASEGVQFNDGVYVVPLDGVASPALFAQTVARACELQPAGAATPLELVIAFFRRRNALLVLDNLEHLLHVATTTEDGVTRQIARLLGGTDSGLKVLATSREPLCLQEEWLYPVEGLSYSAEPAAPASGKTTPSASENAPAMSSRPPSAAPGGAHHAADARKFAAVQFFSQRARQAGAAFSLEAELPHVLLICTLLQGLPLGIELAASWVGSVRVDVLAAGVQEHAAALANRHANRVERHHSLGAVVAYSWQHLDDDQRIALASLAVLRGSFTNEAAREVAYADKS
ncbi:MAG: BTAD domain-containing putative transcriptional regulator, partial [Betaproteobacteria bacterium]